METASSTRVPESTAEHINEMIRRETEGSIAQFASAGRAAIDRRLAELEREWDTERTLEANAATLALIGLGLGATVSRLWFAFPAVIAGFLLQHALQGWCPPLPLLRRMGVRTRREIDTERYALKALRGDFDNLPQVAGEAPRGSAARLLERMEH
jgi:hypothetical protein